MKNFTDRNGNKEAQTLEDDPPIEEEGRPWWASNRPEFMIELRFKDGDRVAYSYGDFRGVKFEPGKTLVLFFDTATITIIGKSLETLLSDLRRHHVVYIRQQHVDAMFERNRITGGFVDSIEIKEPNLEPLGQS